jgi:hypothetical protein
MFSKFSTSRQDLNDKGSFKVFSSIKNLVMGIINTEADKEGRIKAWKDAAIGGNLFGSGPEDIPDYDEDAWHNERDNLKRKKDSSIVVGLDVFKFYQAASVHRTHVLRHLLPSHGLVVA